jgi:LPS-assembly lipoprotein
MMNDEYKTRTTGAASIPEAGTSRKTRWCSFIVHHSLFIILLPAALLLSSCGFQLRGPATLPFNTLYVEAAPTSQFATQLRRVIGASGRTRVTSKAEEADATLQVLNEVREKEILSLSAGGRVREFQLRYRVSYQLIDKNKGVLVPPGEIVLRRDFAFNDQDQISKESEEALLYRDMQTDAVQQLLRRVQATARVAAKS